MRAIHILYLFVVTFLTGCATVKQEMWIYPDGSARIYFELGVMEEALMDEVVENPFTDLAKNSSIDQEVTLGEFYEGGQRYFFADFQITNLVQFTHADDYTTLEEKSGVYKFSQILPPRDSDLADLEPFISNEYYDIIIHVPTLVRSNGVLGSGKETKVSQTDANTTYWRIPLAEALIHGHTIPIELEYQLTASTTKVDPAPVTLSTTTQANLVVPLNLDHNNKVDSALLETIRSYPPTFSEDFDIDMGRWPIYKDENSNRGLKDGSYFISYNEPNSITWSEGSIIEDNFLFEVDTNVTSAQEDTNFGVFFRYQDQKNFYYFWLNVQGRYTLRKHVHGEKKVLLSGDASNIVNTQTGGNRLGVYSDKNTIAILLNGKILDVVQDDTFSYGDIALSVANLEQPGIHVTFDNFNIWDFDKLTCLSSTASIESMSFDTLIDLGDICIDHNQNQEAYLAYDRAFILDSGSAEALTKRGFASHRLNTEIAARKDFNQAVSLDPNYAPAYARRAWGYQIDGQLDKALSDIERAISLQPKQASFYGDRGLIFQAQGKLDKALADFNKMFELTLQTSEKTETSDIASVYYDRGWFHLQEGNYVAALADYNKSISWDHFNPFVYKERGFVYKEQGEFWNAHADYYRAIYLAPTHADTYQWLGHLYYDDEAYETALTVYSKWLELDRNNTVAYLSRGNVYLNLDQFAKAIADYDTAIRLAPKDASGYYGRALVYDKQNNYKEAFRAYGQVLELDASDNEQTRYACERQNDLYGHVTDSLFAKFRGACNRFPSEPVYLPGNSKNAVCRTDMVRDSIDGPSYPLCTCSDGRSYVGYCQ